MVFTPVSGFQEIGVVTKLLVDRVEPRQSFNVDTEFSVRVMELSAGFKARGGPKPPPVTVSIKSDFEEAKKQDKTGDVSEEYDESVTVNEEDNIYWKGDLEVRIELKVDLAFFEDIIQSL